MDLGCLIHAGDGSTHGVNTEADPAIRGEIPGPDPARKVVNGVRLNIHRRTGRFQIQIVFAVKGEPERLRA